jgi:tight adherence protein C
MPVSVVIVLAFIVLSLVLFLIMYLFVPARSVLDERLSSFDQGSAEAEGVVLGQKKPPGAWQIFLGKLGRSVPLRPSEYGKYARMLVSAGIRAEMVPVFLGFKFFSVAVLGGLFVIYGIPAGSAGLHILLIALIFAIIGYLLPTYWLMAKIKARKLSIFQDLPDILDLMMVCVEAGLSVDAAMIRIAGSGHYESSALAQEMKQCVQEIRAGKPRHESLRDMGERTEEEDLRGFAAMLIQSERLGTSLVEALRIHSDTLRTKRRQKAEEQAAKTTIKLLFPLVFFLLPAIMVVVVLPAIIRILSFLTGL